MLRKKLTGKKTDIYEFKSVRENPGVKEAEFTFGDTNLRIAIVHGLANARKVMDDIKNRKNEYHFVEVMAMPWRMYRRSRSACTKR